MLFDIGGFIHPANFAGLYIKVQKLVAKSVHICTLRYMMTDTPNPIDRYILETGDNLRSLAGRAKCSVEAFYKYRDGSRRPRKHKLKPISDAMGGFYSPEQLEAYFEEKAKH